MVQKIYTPIQHTNYFIDDKGDYYTQVDSCESFLKVGKRSVPPAVIEQQRINFLVERDRKDTIKKITTGRVPSDPTRFFEMGERVQYGAHKETYITEILHDSTVYGVFIKSSLKHTYLTWIELEKYQLCGDTSFKPDERQELRINYYNNDIDSLLYKIYHSGVDFNPDYQRDLVWTLEQKEALIDSIFNNIEIGKFSFIKRDYSYEIFYEILDGKQRLTTLQEFYEDRFKYKGKTFSELSFQDKHWFRGFPTVQGECEEPKDRKLIYRYFCKLNTAGVPMAKEHLEKIYKMSL